MIVSISETNTWSRVALVRRANIAAVCRKLCGSTSRIVSKNRRTSTKLTSVDSGASDSVLTNSGVVMNRAPSSQYSRLVLSISRISSRVGSAMPRAFSIAVTSAGVAFNKSIHTTLSVRAVGTPPPAPADEDRSRDKRKSPRAERGMTCARCPAQA